MLDNTEIKKDEFVGYTHDMRTDLISKDGMWECVLTYRQDRSKDMQSWERRQVKFRVVDKDLGHAIYMANFTLSQLLSAYNGDIFNAPESEIETV
jgi:hypothetical protein